ncbi:MAG: GTPase [Methylococcales bacterium]|nr:GTPase [Methylococcales bacterium]
MSKNFWQRLGDTVLKPKAESLPIPALEPPGFWLLGKTQVGKTSLIRALTGQSDMEIGNGFTACTRQTLLYDFPDRQRPLLRFIDTRGLEEAGYDPAEDIAACRQQAHVLVVVMRALDMNQGAVLEMVGMLKKQHPDWPLLVVQTCLHEAYQPGERHVDPYPYQRLSTAAGEDADHADLIRHAPTELLQALAYQRRWFKPFQPLAFVPVDFTLPEDGLAPCAYGLDALWDAIDLAWPDAALSLLRGSSSHKDWQDHHAQAAHGHILSYALANLGLGAVPAAGLPLTMACMSKMLHSIASIYQLELNKTLFTEFATLMGSGFGFALAGREAVKLIPGYGWAVAGVWAGASTYGLGKAFCAYLHARGRGALPDAGELRAVYKAAFREGRQLLHNKAAS